MAKERVIRDWLVKNLFMIEDDLQVVEVEHHLPNAFGSRGFVDILARDRFGLLVIVEIKRSNQAARQAITELCKYAGLVKAQYGLSPQRIRSILVSTEWHELRVPFSEYVRIADHPVSGYNLEVSPSGEVLQVTPVPLCPVTEEKEMCPSHMIYLFSSAERRDKEMPRIASAISEVGITDFCIVALERSKKEVPYPYAGYAAIDAIPFSDRPQVAEQLSVDLEGAEFEENPWYLEDMAWAAVNRKIIEIEEVDSLEIGYPEKLSDLLQKWDVRRILRSGRISSAEVMPDELLLQQLTGLTGSHSAAFLAVTSPRLLSWGDTLQRAQTSMDPNEALKSIFAWYTRTASPEATVTISIFNPANIMGSLYAFATREDPNYFPFFEIVVSEGDKARILEGFLKWDGTTFPEDPEKIAVRIERSPWNFFFLWTTGGLAAYDSRLLRAHGLSFAFVETTLSSGGEPSYRLVQRRRGVWEATSELRPAEVLTVGDFVVRNAAYLFKLVAFVQSNVITVP